MCKKLLLSLLVLAFVSSTASAANVFWNGSVDTNWANGGNWDGGAPSTSLDWADIRNGDWVQNFPVIPPLQTVAARTIRMGPNFGGTPQTGKITVDGGTLSLQQEIYIGDSGGPSDFIMNSGTVDVGLAGFTNQSFTAVGSEGGSGKLLMNGGTFNAGTLGLPKWWSTVGTGNAIIDGGNLNTSGIIIDSQGSSPTSGIQFTKNRANGGGLLTDTQNLNATDWANWQTSVGSWISGGRIASSTGGTVQANFSSVGSVRTTEIFSAASQTAPDVGVIRWDAWVGSGNAVGNEVNASLSPNQFHNKLPFYADVLGPNSVNIDATSQTIMDQEIDFAVRAGLDYWAFIWYPSSSGLHQSRNLYLNSTRKSEIDFSLVVESVRFGSNQITHQELVNSFLDPSYQTVLNGRPLLYFFDNLEITPADINTIRSLSIAQGTGDPYITIMHIAEGDFATEFNTYGFDAASRYATTWVGDGEPHSSLVTQDAGQWNWFDNSLGLEVIPHVTTGWDNRPRILNPSPFWNPASNSWVEPATPSEITDHVADAVQWVADNPGAAAANNILLYAWNEFDEGGSLAPNLPEFGGTDRIVALRNVLVGTGGTIPADFFLDGTVDGLDLAQWAGDLGLNANSDSNGDGITDGSDFLAWQRTFGINEGAASSSSAQTVPEPSAAIFAIFAGLFATRSRFRN